MGIDNQGRSEYSNENRIEAVKMEVLQQPQSPVSDLPGRLMLPW